MAVETRLADEHGVEVDAIWSDDGIVFRVADVDAAPDLDLYFPRPDEVEALVLRGLDRSALFAARFRENAGRALLLPRKMPGKRSPLWAQRKRAADLLAVASKYGSFPIVLETYRECLKDALDIPGLVLVLSEIEDRRMRIVRVESKTPSPFASSLLFSYVANFLYDGDTPLAERRAQALSLDQERLRELLGEVELRELLDDRAIAEADAELQHLGQRLARHTDGVHDLLLALGDLTTEEIRARSLPELDVPVSLRELEASRRIVQLPLGGQVRWVAVEEVARYRDALGASPPPGLPSALLEPVENAVVGIASRWARTHGPFTLHDFARRYGLSEDAAASAYRPLVAEGRVLAGSFRPAGAGEELCDAEVLRMLKRKSLAKLRRDVEPVPGAALSRFLVAWHELHRPRVGLEGLLATLEQLEGLALPLTAWLEDVLPARVRGFTVADLDDLAAAGEIVWRGHAPIADYDGRVSFHLTDRFGLLAPPAAEPTSELALRARAALEQRGALFFSELVTAVGGFPGDVLEALWDLVWAGLVTNDTTLPLRSRFKLNEVVSPRAQRFRSRRALAPGGEGRWSLLPTARAGETERRAALAAVLLERYGVVTREVVEAEGIAGGFSVVYPVLRAMEEAGKVRRGYFVGGLGAAQFARPGVEERLRAVRDVESDDADERSSRGPLVLAATDPANAFGAALPWPESASRLGRAPGAHVVLDHGELIGYLPRGGESLISLFPEGEGPEAKSLRARAGQALARALAADVAGRRGFRHLSKIDGGDASKSALSAAFVEAGFEKSGSSLLLRREGSFGGGRRRR
jgi:ATP-dependent Lhr-like helicase